MKYITVSNRVNRIATVHLSSCSHLGENPEASSESAERRGFEDGFDALAFAAAERPGDFLLCGLCLRPSKAVVGR